MANLNTANYSLYKQALVDPSQLTEEDLLHLIVRYPYAQPLIFAYERRKNLLNEHSPNKELALLYAPNASWLWNYVHKPVEVVEELIPEQEEYIPFVELDEQTDEVAPVEMEIEVPEVDVTLEEENSSTETVVDLIADSEVVISEEETDVLHEELVEAVEEEQATNEHERDGLETLAFEGSIVSDYFLFDKKEKTTEATTEAKSEDAKSKAAEEQPNKEKDNISLYNDDLMPYSFRWWLHKTRLEHADTYQPFAVSFVPYKDAAPVFLNNLEKTILDQQIKENIIHLQDPEMKLSDEVKQRVIESVQPKKSDPIIERFIKEEPIIQPPAPDSINNENMARQSAEDNYVFVTETLAKIYEDQGLYLKAIEVFKKLILKYPEKKSYFANRIQELEKNL